MQKKRCGLTCQRLESEVEVKALYYLTKVGERPQGRGGMTRCERARTLEGLMPNAGIHGVPAPLL